MQCIFNLYKPLGVTSHRVVAAIRRASHERRVGHAGTLDPGAEGVLLVCVGAATRVVEYLMQGIKTYCAEICLGVSTDTYDGEGRVTRIAPVEGIGLAQAEAALATLVGEIDQIPPSYSAIKKDGVPLYRLARQGQRVEAPPRRVRVYEARLVAFHSPLVRVEFRCSAGTYIRSLAHDLGQRLGCGAHLSHLVRVASGRFSIEEAVDVPVLVDALEGGYWQEFAYATDEALLDMDALLLGEEHERIFRNGGNWAAIWGGNAAAIGKVARSYSSAGEAIGIAELRDGRWWPRKVFA
ncbi:MAG: tRNA pseudouridine(55) synthase TruB [Bacteroidetes bacterium]|nr:tRNA pseudouridine(55) synthase TruB [Bacteroidota bacterium]MCL5025295.1 tRNA pseudouridine(55) synthase TruB [Chloroflexota bacterium]